VSLRFVDGLVPGPARVSYAVGRTVGGAVARNRVRRRLRAAVAEHRDALVPGRAYLLAAGREVLTVPFAELATDVARLLGSASDGRRRP
jgi:ribonuclease P protein component